MPATRALLEAQAHHRRRVLIAFLMADAEGPDESIPGAAPLLGGLVVAVAVLVGALVSGLVTHPPPPGWGDGHLVVGRASGSRFVGLGGTLHPVLNTASARLALPAGSDLTVLVVDDQTISAAPRGSVLGIAGAPDELPPRSGLLPSGWVACVDGTGVRTTISSRPGAHAPPELVLTVRVATRGEVGGALLVAGHRFSLPRGREERVTRFLGFTTPPLSVPPGWATLFPDGTALDGRAFRFPAGSVAGRPLPPGLVPPGSAEQSGQLLTNTDHGGTMSVVLVDGTVALTPFAAAVYRATAPGRLGEPRAVTDADLASTPISTARGFTPDDWPRALPGSAATAACARLDAGEGRPARTELVPQGQGYPGARPSRGATVAIEQGRGAIVRSGTTPGRGPVVLVDPAGVASTIVDPSPETLDRLGYGDLDPPSVPPAWLALFPPGPDLSHELVDVQAGRAPPG